MRQVTARYFFRLKYHQGYYQACLDIDKAMREMRVRPKERLTVNLIREWAAKKLTEWDDSPDKKDWRNDRPPAVPHAPPCCAAPANTESVNVGNNPG